MSRGHCDPSSRRTVPCPRKSAAGLGLARRCLETKSSVQRLGWPRCSVRPRPTPRRLSETSSSFPWRAATCTTSAATCGRPNEQLGTLSSGFGYMWSRVGFMAIARVGMGPNKSRLGWGGARGYYSLIGNDLFELGPDLSIMAGGGKGARQAERTACSG